MKHRRRPLEERFWTKVAKADVGCWEWLGARTAGYGSIGSGGDRGPTLYAHRVAYELLVGPIPEGMVIDHLCENRGCVRPDHLEAVTSAVNNLRAARKRHRCKRGHPLTAGNLYVSARSRKCRTCSLERARAQRSH